MAAPSLSERLATAEAALDRLLTGQSLVEVQDANGDRVRYTAARVADLQAYVARLRRELAGASQRPPSSIRLHTSKGI